MQIRETAYVFTSFMCVITTDLTNARCARKLFPSHLALTNTYECTAVTDRTSVLTASKASRPPLFCALTFVSIAEKSRLNVDIAGALSPHTRHMIVTCDAITVSQTSFANLLYNCVVRASKHSVSLILKAQRKIGKNRNVTLIGRIRSSKGRGGVRETEKSFPFFPFHVYTFPFYS